MRSLTVVSLLVVLSLVAACAGGPTVAPATSVPPSRVAEPPAPMLTPVAQASAPAVATAVATPDAAIWGRAVDRMMATTSSRARSQLDVQVSPVVSGQPSKATLVSEIEGAGDMYYRRNSTEWDAKPQACGGFVPTGVQDQSSADESIQVAGATYSRSGAGSWRRAEEALKASANPRFGGIGSSQPGTIGLRLKGKGEARGVPSYIYGLNVPQDQQMAFGALPLTVSALYLCYDFGPGMKGFESFDAELYLGAQDELPRKLVIRLRVLNESKQEMSAQHTLEFWDFDSPTLDSELEKTIAIRLTGVGTSAATPKPVNGASPTTVARPTAGAKLPVVRIFSVVEQACEGTSATLLRKVRVMWSVDAVPGSRVNINRASSPGGQWTVYTGIYESAVLEGSHDDTPDQGSQVSYLLTVTDPAGQKVQATYPTSPMMVTPCTGKR